MKVIFLALSISNSKDGGIYTDLIREFNTQGEDILVLAPSNDPKDVGLRDEYGIKVLRVITNDLFHPNIFRKGLANLLLPYQFKRALKKYCLELDFDLILMPTPPITLTGVAAWIKKKSKKKAKIYLILRDIFPQNAVDLHFMKPEGFIYKYFRKKEKQLYCTADEIGCMSPANVDYVLKHNPEVIPSKLHLLPNWKNISDQPEKLDTINSALIKKLKSKFVVIFGGNIGKPQKLENIVELAKNVSDYKDIHFFIIGRGTERRKIGDLIKTEGLQNMELHDPIWSSEYQHILDASDVGLISLSEEFSIPNFPSKVLSYFSSQLPVLASLDMNTDFGQMLEKTKSGLWAPAGNTKLLKDKLLFLYNNREVGRRMGKNGHAHMVNKLLPHHAYDTITGKI